MHGTLICVAPTLKWSTRFGEHTIAFGCDVFYLPRQRRHPFGAPAKRFTNGLTPYDWLPRGVPPDSIVRKETRELIDVPSNTCFNKPPNQRNILSVVHSSIRPTT